MSNHPADLLFLLEYWIAPITYGPGTHKIYNRRTGIGYYVVPYRTLRTFDHLLGELLQHRTKLNLDGLSLAPT